MVLLKAGADANTRESGTGRTPLHYITQAAVEGSALHEANRINHHKLATHRPKEGDRWVLDPKLSVC